MTERETAERAARKKCDAAIRKADDVRALSNLEAQEVWVKSRQVALGEYDRARNEFNKGKLT